MTTIPSNESDDRDRNPAEGDLCQGDVLLFHLPEGWTPALADTVPPRADKLILAEGEATGHQHAIWMSPPMFRDDGLARSLTSGPRGDRSAIEAQSRPPAKPLPATLYRDEKLLRRLVEDGMLTDGSLCVGFLVVENAPVLLRHPEHDAIRIPPGIYYVSRQREFHAGQARAVAD